MNLRWIIWIKKNSNGKIAHSSDLFTWKSSNKPRHKQNESNKFRESQSWVRKLSTNWHYLHWTVKISRARVLLTTFVEKKEQKTFWENYNWLSWQNWIELFMVDFWHSVANRAQNGYDLLFVLHTYSWGLTL